MTSRETRVKILQRLASRCQSRFWRVRVGRVRVVTEVGRPRSTKEERRLGAKQGDRCEQSIAVLAGGWSSRETEGGEGEYTLHASSRDRR